MGFLELFLVALGLSMDAFAVAVCKGLSSKKLLIRHCITVGLWFGIFQGLMPAIGYLVGSTFSKYINAFDHWIAFVLLGIIGANMLKEGLSKEEVKEDKGCSSCSFAAKTMLVLAVATSIDALAVGISFALIPPDIGILFAVLLIGIITFLLSIVGVIIGNIFGIKYKSRAETAGGVILILMGLKILLQHLGIINF